MANHEIGIPKDHEIESAAAVEMPTSPAAPATTLFPILDSRPAGLARIAAEATHAEDGHLIEFRSMRSKSLLNHSVSKRMGWKAWTINPYRGCEFGCKYCYARYTHEFLRPEPITPVEPGTYEAPQQDWALAFEREIYLKENAAWLLEQELKSVPHDEELALGTATDPYQPIERRVGITRSILEVMARQQGRRLGIVTKSNLIVRDVDLLVRIAERNALVVHITVTTTDAALARKLEPRAPRPDLRLAAVKTLREAGVITGVLCSPLLPGINDSLRSLEQVASAAAAAGASFLGAHPLFLKSCSRPTYLSFVREHFPALVPDYERRYATKDFVDAGYRQRMALLVRRLCATHGLAERVTEAILTRDPKDPKADERKRYFTPRLPVDDPSMLSTAPAMDRKEPQKAVLEYPEPAQAALFG
ncbi:DNA repair photolyase [Bryocella elongata]|uniref:DNA repair photolyase n=1 Tax=Bryocella elongata TaxID=863522 RepID=A0A1H6B0H3_9BACT|nr:radical SAM protein [Bryocella elongata]SEG54308.1 DNA repair photolyase [Bryocella elongata]